MAPKATRPIATPVRRSTRVANRLSKAAANQAGKKMEDAAAAASAPARKRNADTSSDKPPSKRPKTAKAANEVNTSSIRKTGPTKAPKKGAAPKRTSGRAKAQSADNVNVGAAPSARKIAVAKKPSAKTKPSSKKTTDTAAHKAAPKRKTAAAKTAKSAQQNGAAAKTSTKRKNEETTSESKAKKVRFGPTINEAPTQRLNVYVCGEGGMGELGLGTARKAMDVKRPRLNPYLASDSVGVVHVATGGMHCAALTYDNKILTWGVNDHGALGRDTTWEGGLVDMDNENKKDSSNDEDDADSDDDNGLNPRESVPGAVPTTAFPEGTKFTRLAAGDNVTYAVTADGSVYGWGTFRSNEGVLGFSKDVHIQYTPTLIPGLKRIKDIVCGANHCLALDVNGNVFAWGNGQQNQLGRRIVERNRMEGLTPRQFGLSKKKIQYIASGTDHCFAIDKNDNVYAWGLNCLGECAIAEGAGDDDATVVGPTKVNSLSGRKMKMLKGGLHHSVGVTEAGECLLWGAAGGAQIGLDIASLPEESVRRDEHGKPKILLRPTALPDFDCKTATAASDHTLAVTIDGKAYSWGFSATYQTGQGTTEDIDEPTQIDNTALRGKDVVWVGGGGQFSLLAAVADQPTVNGHTSS